MLWESLVTDGHVRAARIRRLQPWMFVLGLLLIWIGVLVAGLAPAVRPSNSVVAIVQQRVGALQQRANAAFATLPRPALDAAALEKLPPVKEISEVIAATQQSLDKSGDLADDQIQFKEIEADAFWRGAWGSEQVSYLKSGSFYLVAALATSGSGNYLQAQRWVGAFKKFSGKWEYTTISTAGLYQPPQLPAVAPANIALSLKSLLPEPPKPADQH